MNKDKEDRIRVRAFEIWQKSGQPEGSHDDHWHQATREIDAEDGIGTSPATEQVAPAWAPDPDSDQPSGPAEPKSPQKHKPLG